MTLYILFFINLRFVKNNTTTINQCDSVSFYSSTMIGLLKALK